uniref:Magnesium-dependent phosphatase-1 n=1 Tax=Corethron hystrix TaxID=216773 RepID=A0A7S1C0N6_9STRA|mmetsp:Transcript_7865/g.17085  ORF Transcript_7865/g.17085 Transcript_7865/m.17085 type:complete len:254 (+) Transcript_7865:42-803(+)
MKYSSLLRSAFAASSALRRHAIRPLRTSFSISAPSMSSSSENIYPALTVFDLDACLWDQEMYEMPAMPSRPIEGDLNGRGAGVKGAMSGPYKISLHAGSLVALQEHHDGLYPGMKVALASSADTPKAEKIGRAALRILEVVPGVTVWDVLMRDWDGVDVNQIGRQPPLSSNKARSHFPRIRELTQIRYDEMLFFDDCNWGDHCRMVSDGCKEKNGEGVVSVRTPYGLREAEWREGLQTYKEKLLARRQQKAEL